MGVSRVWFQSRGITQYPRGCGDDAANATSFACLAFAFIGVPLGIKARRRDTSTGLILSLVIGAAYFVGGNMISDSGLDPWMAWIPNIACILLGIILFRRARFR